MKTYISDIIPKIQRFSQKLDNLTLLTNQHWVVIDDINGTKLVYIFRQNSELLISKNGRVKKAKWEYLGNNSLLIDNENESYLFKHGFFDENILALKIDSKDEYAFLVNETKYDNELNSVSNVIDFLNSKYVEGSIKKDIQNKTGLRVDNTKEQNLEVYTAPDYTINKISENNPIIGEAVEKYLVKYSDGKEGSIFLIKDNKHAYFKAKINGMWVKTQQHYKNIELCVVGFHYFLKYRRISINRFINSYSN